jgi:hypothetical protein
MRLLRHFHDKEELHAAVSLLHSKGIPTHLKYSGAPAVWPTPYRVALFVCLARHLSDALQVLKDPDHKVSEPVDVKAYEEGLKAQGTSTLLVKLSALVLVGSAVFLFFAVWAHAFFFG